VKWQNGEKAKRIKDKEKRINGEIDEETKQREGRFSLFLFPIFGF
jgi:hypothetical protein